MAVFCTTSATKTTSSSHLDAAIRFFVPRTLSILRRFFSRNETLEILPAYSIFSSGLPRADTPTLYFSRIVPSKLNAHRGSNSFCATRASQISAGGASYGSGWHSKANCLVRSSQISISGRLAVSAVAERVGSLELATSIDFVSSRLHSHVPIKRIKRRRIQQVSRVSTSKTLAASRLSIVRFCGSGALQETRDCTPKRQRYRRDSSFRPACQL